MDPKFLAELDDTWVILGASGFIGRWICLLGQLLNTHNVSKINTIAVSRNPTRARDAIERFFPRGVPLPQILSYDELYKYHSALRNSSGGLTVFHGATSSNQQDVDQQFNRMVTDELIQWLNHLEQPTLINLSSGAVYAPRETIEMPYAESDSLHFLSGNSSPYVKRKLDLEALVKSASLEGNIRGFNARLFAFAGPGLPLKSHFAIANFVMSAMSEKTIRIKGHPHTMRSYMSPQDLLLWLLNIVQNIDSLSGESLNIGSQSAITMFDLARRVQDIFGADEIIIENSNNNPATFYVPNTSEFNERFSVPDLIPLDEILLRWKWYLN